MWFGTYDGVNCYDGKGIEVFRSDFSMKKTLSNNVIHSIQQADSSTQEEAVKETARPHRCMYMAMW